MDEQRLMARWCKMAQGTSDLVLGQVGHSTPSLFGSPLSAVRGKLRMKTAVSVRVSTSSRGKLFVEYRLRERTQALPEAADLKVRIVISLM